MALESASHQALVEPTGHAYASPLSEVLESLLDDIRRQTGDRRVVVVGQLGQRIMAVGHGVDEFEVTRFAAAIGDGTSTLPWPAGAWVDHAAPLAALACMRSPVVVSPGAGGGPAAVAAVLEGGLDHTDLDPVREILRNGRRILALSADTQALRARVRELETQLAQARQSLEALPDAVMVIDADARIRLANRRAEELFVIGPDDLEGRRHARETNNLYFSAFRARSALEGRGGPLRELVLVDPTDGSDLLFEVAVLPAHEGGGTSVESIFLLRDITDLKRATRELEVQFGRVLAAQHREEREAERLNVIIENAGVPILVTDAQANLMLMNRDAARLLADAAPLPGRPGSRGTRDNDARLAGLINDFVLQRHPRHEGRLTLVDPDDGREFPTLAVSTKILNEHAETIAVVTILRDLTQEVENQRLAQELSTINEELSERIAEATRELAERNAQLERQSAELERASRLKSEFLATMSHELRTPINAMVGYSSLLRDGIFGPLSDRQQDALRRMRKSAEHLLSIINDILDLSRVEAGQVRMSATDVDLAECLQTVAESVRPMAVQKSLEFIVEISPDIPSIRTDATRLSQVVLNLLSNAVKFTERGSVTMRAVPLADCTRFRVDVEDTGIGIAEEHLETIFDQFTQADQSATRQHGGTGLGLTISRKLIELMGGELGVVSRLGSGSTFHIELPVVPPIAWGDIGGEEAAAGSARHMPAP
jgi:PAS domain S-box-containing protein